MQEHVDEALCELTQKELENLPHQLFYVDCGDQGVGWAYEPLIVLDAVLRDDMRNTVYTINY